MQESVCYVPNLVEDVAKLSFQWSSGQEEDLGREKDRRLVAPSFSTKSQQGLERNWSLERNLSV